MSDPELPITRYKLTVTIRGNSHEEIESELLTMTRGGYLLDSDGHKRDQFHTFSGRVTSQLEHLDPNMTPERYAAALDEWIAATRTKP